MMMLLILLSPKYDAQNRGFVACTQSLLDELVECEHKIGCSMRAVAANSWCDIKTIVKGAKDWLNGQQDTPWSNYIYEPEMPKNPLIDEDARAEYLRAHPNTKEDMERLHRQRKEMENEQNSTNEFENFWPEQQ